MGPGPRIASEPRSKNQRFSTADITWTRRSEPASRPLLSRVEAHFHLAIHSDRVAAPGRGLITELRPRHGLAELRAAVELRNLAFLVDDDFAASRSARGFPKGPGCQEGLTLAQLRARWAQPRLRLNHERIRHCSGVNIVASASAANCKVRRSGKVAGTAWLPGVRHRPRWR